MKKVENKLMTKNTQITIRIFLDLPKNTINVKQMMTLHFLRLQNKGHHTPNGILNF
jgi:hypothetical protein